MRKYHYDQLVNELRLLESERPGQRAAPIVGEQKSFAWVGRFDQRRHVSHQRAGFVGRDFLRGVSAAVTAQVGRPYAIAQMSEQRHLMSPGISVFRKAVQAERQAVARAHGGDLKVDA